MDKHTAYSVIVTIALLFSLGSGEQKDRQLENAALRSAHFEALSAQYYLLLEEHNDDWYEYNEFFEDRAYDYVRDRKSTILEDAKDLEISSYEDYCFGRSVAEEHAYYYFEDSTANYLDGEAYYFTYDQLYSSRQDDDIDYSEFCLDDVIYYALKD